MDEKDADEFFFCAYFYFFLIMRKTVKYCENGFVCLVMHSIKLQFDTNTT